MASVIVFTAKVINLAATRRLDADGRHKGPVAIIFRGDVNRRRFRPSIIRAAFGQLLPSPQRPAGQPYGQRVPRLGNGTGFLVVILQVDLHPVAGCQVLAFSSILRVSLTPALEVLVLDSSFPVDRPTVTIPETGLASPAPNAVYGRHFYGVFHIGLKVRAGGGCIACGAILAIFCDQECHQPEKCLRRSR